MFGSFQRGSWVALSGIRRPLVTVTVSTRVTPGIQDEIARVGAGIFRVVLVLVLSPIVETPGVPNSGCCCCYRAGGGGAGAGDGDGKPAGIAGAGADAACLPAG